MVKVQYIANPGVFLTHYPLFINFSLSTALYILPFLPLFLFPILSAYHYIPYLYPSFCLSLSQLEIYSSFLECTQKFSALWCQHFLIWAAATTASAPIPHKKRKEKTLDRRDESGMKIHKILQT